MRTGVDIQGLTTAATIWVNAAVGVAVGAGEYRVAVVATGVALAALVTLDPIERMIDRHHAKKETRPTAGGPSEADGAAPSPERQDAPPRSKPR